MTLIDILLDILMVLATIAVILTVIHIVKTSCEIFEPSENTGAADETEHSEDEQN